MNLTAIIEQDKEGWYLGHIPSLYGCRTQAKSLPELYERLEEVALLCLEEEHSIAETEEKKFIGVQNLQIPSLTYA